MVARDSKVRAFLWHMRCPHAWPPMLIRRPLWMRKSSSPHATLSGCVTLRSSMNLPRGHEDGRLSFHTAGGEIQSARTYHPFFLPHDSPRLEDRNPQLASRIGLMVGGLKIQHSNRLHPQTLKLPTGKPGTIGPAARPIAYRHTRRPRKPRRVRG